MILMHLQWFGGRGSGSKLSRGRNLAPLGALSKSEYLNNTGPDPGLSSEDGSLKHITLYHGSFSNFDDFDYEKGKEGKAGGADAYGEGFYFTSDPEVARTYGDHIYTVDVAYSTNRRVAKRTGREQDFSYNPDTGYWVIPKDKADHLRILRKRKVN